MSYARPSARTLTGVLLALMLFSIVAAPVALGKDTPVSQSPMIANPSVACGTTVTAPDGTKTFTVGNKPTGWGDDIHPPTTVRVLRSQGPNKGHVETVDFWWYVGVVMRAEYSTGMDKPPLWMQVGSITVKEYAWWKAMHWGGGKVTFTSSVTDPTTGGITTTTTNECYDVKDTTADQLYKPEKWNATTGTWDPGNVPNANINKAMAQTWNVSMRKWNSATNSSRLFLSGYRSGSKNACGVDSTGFKIYQASLRDCLTKKLTLEETLRKYFESMLLVNGRSSDLLDDNGAWWGDVPVLSSNGGTTSWSVFPGKINGFAAPVTGSFNLGAPIVDSGKAYGSGNVDLPSTSTSPDDDRLLADLVMVTNGDVYAARATGNGFASAVKTDFNGSVSRAVFGDFDGDLMMDVGLVRDNGDGTASLWVMKANGDDTFAAPVQVWTGADITNYSFVAAGDVNGDGKADLIVRDDAGNFDTAVSPPSCASMTPIGTCASPGTFVLGTLNLALADPGGLSDAKFSVGDYDRDGRADVIALVTGSTSTVYGMRAKSDNSGTFADKLALWSSSSVDLTGATPVAMNVDADGMADLALVKSGAMRWLRTIERSAGPAQMVLSSDFPFTGMDKSAPTTPAALKGTAAHGLTVSLNWTGSTDNSGGTVFYRVYRNGRKIGTLQTGTTYVDHPKAGWQAYTVKAIDGVGNTSAASNKVSVKAIN